LYKKQNSDLLPNDQISKAFPKTDRCTKLGTCNEIGVLKSEGPCEKHFCKCTEQEIWGEYSCENDQVFNGQKQICETLGKNLDCRNEGTISQQDVRGYIKHHPNHDHQSHCKDFAPCENVGTFKSHGDCHREFCECSSTRQWIVHLCTRPLVYNDQTELCDWPKNVQKCYGNEPNHPSLISSVIDTEPSGEIASSVEITNVDRCGNLFGELCKNVGEFRPQSHCGRNFCECSSTGKWVEHQCSGPLAFNPHTEICEWHKDISECS